MRKLLIILTILLLAAACSPDSTQNLPAPGDIGQTPPEQEPGEKGDDSQDPIPDGDEEPQPQLNRAQAVFLGAEWQCSIGTGGELPRQFGDLLLFNSFNESSSVTAVNLAIDTMFIRDLAADGFMLDESVGYDSDYLITETGVAYPLIKDGLLHVEHLNTETGEIWRHEVGDTELGYRSWGGLIQVVTGDWEDETYSYFNLHTGQSLSFLNGAHVAYFQESYFSYVREGDKGTVKRFDAGTEELVWSAETETTLDYPGWRQWVWSAEDVILCSSGSTAALKSNTGEELWSQNLPLHGIIGGNAVLSDNEKIAVVDVVSGETVWEMALTDVSFFIWNDYLYISSKSYLRKVAPATGDVIWEQRMPDYVRPYSGIFPQGRITEDLQDMDVLWVMTGEYPGGIAEERGYYELELTALHPGTGHIISSWEFTVPFQYGGPWYWPILMTRDEQGRPYMVMEAQAGEPVPFSGHLEFGEYAPGRFLRAIDANTGEELWDYHYSENHCNVLVSDSDYLVVVMTVGEEVELQYLRKASGEVAYKFPLDKAPSLMIGNRLLIYRQGEYSLDNPLD